MIQERLVSRLLAVRDYAGSHVFTCLAPAFLLARVTADFILTRTGHSSNIPSLTHTRKIPGTGRVPTEVEHE